jgi:outer membrane protein assembly factor BamB
MVRISLLLSAFGIMMTPFLRGPALLIVAALSGASIGIVWTNSDALATSGRPWVLLVLSRSSAAWWDPFLSERSRRHLDCESALLHAVLPASSCSRLCFRARRLESGCVDNRVILVDRGGNIVWRYGQFGVTGFGPNQLNTPVQNTYLPNGNVLITDQGKERIIEVRRADNTIVWQYGENSVVGNGPNQLNNPNAAELLANGHILISDENNNRAIEVTHTTPSQIVATFTAQGTVSGVAFASRLPNGNTLLTDSNNNRIVEVEPNDTPVWEYFTNTRPGSNPSPLPTRAVRLANGNTLISDQFNDQVIEINPSEVIVASYGMINDPGYSPSTAMVMNAPYSAYVIGDYTGITPPF